MAKASVGFYCGRWRGWTATTNKIVVADYGVNHESGYAERRLCSDLAFKQPPRLVGRASFDLGLDPVGVSDLARAFFDHLPK